MSLVTRGPPNAVGRQMLADAHEARERNIQEAARRARHPNRFHRFWKQLTERQR